MFKRILLPVDLSDRHQQALEAAADLAGRAGGEVVLLHVVEVIAGLALDEEKAFYQRLERIARSHLTKLGEVLEARQTPWRAEVIIGHRGPEVVRHAAAHGFDLIVLTSPPVDPADAGAGWGSLSHKIGLFAGCPVLLVK